MKSWQELFSLSGKVALITGGSRGLGREMALAFARAGADIAVVSRSLEACKKAAAEVEALGQRGLPFACHMGRWDQIDNLVEEVYKHFGKIDVLINNAGKSPLYESLVDLDEYMWDSVVGLNLKGPFRLSVLVGSRMAEGAGGSIINISSTAAIHPTAREVPYAAAKAGLHALTRALAHAYGPRVRVNCIMPGPFLTDVSKAWDLDAVKKKTEETFALKRPGEPGEIVGSALYLASEASSYTTGSILPVDGGGH